MLESPILGGPGAPGGRCPGGPGGWISNSSLIS